MKTVNESMAAGRLRVALDRDWLAVGASSVGLLFSVGTLSVYTFGVFVQPLAREFHWSRTDLFATLTILQYVLAFSSPFWGNLCDRFGPRSVLLPSIVCLGLLIASLGLLTPHLWHLYLIFTLIPLLAGVKTGRVLFNVVFVAVIVSVAVQGWTAPPAARLLRLKADDAQEV